MQVLITAAHISQKLCARHVRQAAGETTGNVHGKLCWVRVDLRLRNHSGFFVQH